MRVIVSTTPKETAAEVVAQTLLKSREVPTLVLLSGGSWLAVYEILAADFLYPNQTFMMVDERYSEDKKVNNYEQLKATNFWRRASERGCKIIDTSVRVGESLAEFGARFAAALADWQTARPTGDIIALLGLGEDGHTAGIFPDTASARLDYGVDTAVFRLKNGVSLFTDRVSVSSFFLVNRVARAVVYAVGETKCQRLESVLKNQDYDPREPARIIHRLPEVSLITDCQLS